MATGRFDLSNLGFRGRVGDLVFLPQPDGRCIVRRMPSKPVRRSASQEAASGRVVEVAAAWKALTREEGEAWGRWAAGEGRRGYNVFVGLGTKRLQVSPDEPLPRLPPASAFLGDGIVVSIGESVGSLRRCEIGDRGSAIITFRANAANAPGVVTELLVQGLASLHRKPLGKEYKSRGFVSFASGSLAVPVMVEPGAYACAIRFVRADSGQETGVVPIGKVLVAGLEG